MISDMVLVAIIISVPPTLTGAASLWVAIKNRGRIEEIHKATNSMKDELIAATRADALQRGHTAGVAAQMAVEAAERKAKT